MDEPSRYRPGQRIRLLFCRDRNPLPAGATGTVRSWNRRAQSLAVDWDPPYAHRCLSLATDEDVIELITEAPR